MIKEYFKISIKNVRKRKLRSWLTMIGIFVSIAVIFLLISLSLGLNGVVQEQFMALGADKFFIMSKGGIPGTSLTVRPLTLKDIEIIEGVSGVKDITYWVTSPSNIEYRGEKKIVLVAGLPYDDSELFKQLSSFKIEEGKFPGKNEQEKIMVGYQYKLETFFSKPVEIGDIITVNGEKLKVGAILGSTGSPPDDKQLYMDSRKFRKIFNVSDRVDQIWVQVEDQRDPKEIAKRVESKLLQSRGLNEKTQDFVIVTPEDLLRSFSNVLNILTGFLLGIAAISLLVGAVGIANTMYTAVLERTKEIGVMKAIGAKNSSILTLFIIEAGFLGLVGGIIGIGIGMILGKIIEYIALVYLGSNLLKVAFPIWLIFGCILFSFFVGAVSGALPALRASKIKPTLALRYE